MITINSARSTEILYIWNLGLTLNAAQKTNENLSGLKYEKFDLH